MTNYEEIWEMLERYQFKIDNSLLFFCVICNKLLIDAHEGPCGCNYCKKCIIKFLKDKEQYCPGGGGDCLLKELSMSSNIVRVNSVNRKVSQLQVNCPSGDCQFNGDLMQMSKHLKECDKISVLCPFNDIGCSTKLIEREKISDHLVKNVTQHSKLLIDWMLNMRREIHSLTEKSGLKILQELMGRNYSNLEIVIKEDKMVTETRINNLQNEIETLQKQNQELINCIKKMDLEKKESDKKTNEMQIPGNDEFYSSGINALKKPWLSRSNEKLIFKPKNETHKMVFVQHPAIQSIENKQLNEIQNTSSSLEKLFNDPKKTIASFNWKINEIFKSDEHNNLSQYQKSCEFFSNNRQYQMWLQLNLSGCQMMRASKSSVSSQFCIEFYIDIGSDNNEINWPLICAVTITVINQIQPEITKSIRKTCRFDKPNDYSFCIPDESFEFSSQDIEQLRLFKHNSMIVKCQVDKIER